MSVRIGVVGTSWWTDAMYLPALAGHPDAEVVAVCGRREDSTKRFAEQWSIAQWFTDVDALLAVEGLDAVVVATANDSHFPIVMSALARGLHVLCEKPLALDATEAAQMAEAAASAGVVTLVPFTYHYMPVNQWVKRLIGEGYVGRVRHIGLRYFADYASDPAYSWRFDKQIAGAGIIGDLGPHWVHLARWLLADTEVSISAVSTTFVERDPRPDGTPYERLEDSAVMTVRYSSGAYGVLHTSAVCWEGTSFGQTHHLEVHGDEGTIYATCDWDTVQEVRGMRAGDTGGAKVLPIPDDVWNGVRRERVHDTYRDVFRTTDVMTRRWVTAIAHGGDAGPGIDEGFAVQRVVDAASASAATGGCPVSLA